MLAKDVMTEEWLAEVLQNSLDMDWTSTDGARAIMKALETGLVKLPQAGGQIALAATPKPPAGGDAGADAADILDHYARFIRDEVKADDFERHPYLPHIEQIAADLRAALALPAPAVEGDFPREKIARLCLSALYGFEFTGDSLCDEADRIFSRPNVRAAKAVALADAIDAALSEGRSHG